MWTTFSPCLPYRSSELQIFHQEVNKLSESINFTFEVEQEANSPFLGDQINGNSYHFTFSVNRKTLKEKIRSWLFLRMCPLNLEWLLFIHLLEKLMAFVHITWLAKKLILLMRLKRSKKMQGVFPCQNKILFLIKQDSENVHSDSIIVCDHNIKILLVLCLKSLFSVVIKMLITNMKCKAFNRFRATNVNECCE